MEVQVPIEVNMPKHGVAILESRHLADFFMPWRSDPFAKVLYILGGKGKLITGDEEIALKEEQVCLVPPGVRHKLEDERGKPIWLLGLCLHPENSAWSEVIPSLFAKPQVIVNSAMVQESFIGLKTLLFKQSIGKPCWREMQVAWCGMLLVKLLREKDQVSELKAIDQVSLYVERMESSFYLNESLDQVAQRLGIGRRRFSQLFREVTGEAWLQRLRGIRIAHACRLLSKSGKSVKLIAFECGFEGLPQFFRTFKQLKGVTPGQWRKSQEASSESWSSGSCSSMG